MDCLGVECDAMDLEHSARTIKPLRKAITSPRNVSGKAIANVAGKNQEEQATKWRVCFKKCGGGNIKTGT